MVISVALLWVLARIRFPDRAQTPNPVPPVLAQLAPPSAFDDMSATVAQIESRLQPSLVELEVQRHPDGRRRAEVIRNKVLALRFRPDLAVAWIGPDSDFDAVETMPLDALEVARDRASRLVRHPRLGLVRARAVDMVAAAALSSTVPDCCRRVVPRNLLPARLRGIP